MGSEGAIFCFRFFCFSPSGLYQCVRDVPTMDRLLFPHSVTVCAWEGLRLQGHKYLFHAAPKCPMNHDLLKSEPPGTLREGLEGFGEEVVNYPGTFSNPISLKGRRTDPGGQLAGLFFTHGQN